MEGQRFVSFSRQIFDTRWKVKVKSYGRGSSVTLMPSCVHVHGEEAGKGKSVVPVPENACQVGIQEAVATGSASRVEGVYGPLSGNKAKPSTTPHHCRRRARG